MRGTVPQLANTPVAAALPDREDVMVRLSDTQIFSRSFYTVHQFSRSHPADSDGDGIDDLFELQHSLFLDAVNSDRLNAALLFRAKLLKKATKNLSLLTLRHVEKFTGVPIENNCDVVVASSNHC